MPNQENLKQQAAIAAIAYLEKNYKENFILGVGTGSTTNYFIDALMTSSIKNYIQNTVASSKATASRLKDHGFSLVDLSAQDVDVYVDGADEVTSLLQMIKGGGAALTQEKIVATCSRKFICIADSSKFVRALGQFPLPIEVIPLARSYVARQMVILGGDPVYREGVTTDNGNIILDVHHLNLSHPLEMEQKINNITGVVCNGIFAQRSADLLFLATEKGVELKHR